MAKKQTRRSISVSRTTYERLKSFCETNNISMSQLVENRVNDFLGGEGTSVPATTPRPAPAPAPRPMMPAPTPKPTSEARPSAVAPVAAVAPASAPVATQQPQPAQVPMTSAAARYAIDPPPPVIKPKQQENAPKPTEKRPDQIFTF
jgi:hypothetical protein